MLRELINNKTVDKIPDGWMTTSEWRIKESFPSDAQANLCIRKAVKLGLMEMKKFRRIVSDGTVRAVPHYRLLDKSKRA